MLEAQENESKWQCIKNKTKQKKPTKQTNKNKGIKYNQYVHKANKQQTKKYLGPRIKHSAVYKKLLLTSVVSQVPSSESNGNLILNILFKTI